MIELVIFWVFGAVMIFAATMVITARNPVHSAMFLVLAFFNASALWIMAGAEFLGIALVLVYVGAVMVLFLFVVMMLDINLAALRSGFVKHLYLALPVAAVMVVELVMVVGGDHGTAAATAHAAGQAGNTRMLGQVLYTVYAYPFELAACVLLVAIIAAIMLTLRRREDTKHQDPGVQVRVRKADRLRIVKSAPRQARD